MASLLKVDGLSVEYTAERRTVKAVSDLDLELGESEVLGICGESGSGKSTALLALASLIKPPGRIVDGAIGYRGINLLRLHREELRRLRGREIAFVPQNPLRSFDPLITIEAHFVETARAHGVTSSPEIRERSLDLLARLEVGGGERRLRQYSFQLSGGTLQRIMLALAMFHRPRLLLADEPTTALDVSTQASLLLELRRLRDEFGTAIVVVSHDIGVINVIADAVLVMYAGRCVESGPRRRVLGSPLHPYTQALIACIPRDGRPAEAISGHPPDLACLPDGCPFAPRCPHVLAECTVLAPALREPAPDARVACHLYGSR